jgi:nucleoside diphosphate kinase
MKYYEVLFFDQTGICIKSNVENPSKEQVTEFLKVDFENHGYNINDIEDIAEISLEEAKLFYDMENEKVFPVLCA